MVSTDRKFSNLSRLAFCCLALLASHASLAADAGVETEPRWVDARHRQISERSDELAEWADNFFGGDISVEESATSVVRVRPQFEWDEEDDTDWKLRATGRFYLPRSNDRLSLVFFGEDGDFEDDFAAPCVSICSGTTPPGNRKMNGTWSISS